MKNPAYATRASDAAHATYIAACANYDVARNARDAARATYIAAVAAEAAAHTAAARTTPIV